MSRKPAPQRPKDREAVMLQARALLAEHFSHGIAVVSWEDQGTTYYMDFKFGNDYACRAITREAEDMLWPYEPDDDEDEEEEEET